MGKWLSRMTFSQCWATATAAAWTLLCLALVVMALRQEEIRVGGPQSVFYQAGMAALAAATIVSWLFVVVRRRRSEVYLMAVLGCGFAVVQATYAFIERPVKTYALTVNGGLVTAFVMFLMMSCLLLWQAFHKGDAPRDSAPAVID